MTEDRRQMTDDGRQKTDDGRQMTEVFEFGMIGQSAKGLEIRAAAINLQQ
jgi:hypothetical protein